MNSLKKYKKLLFYSLLIIGTAILIFSIGYNDDLELILLEGSGL